MFRYGSFGSTQHYKMMLKEDEGLVATLVKHPNGILFQEFSQPFHLGSHGSLLQIPRPNRVIGMTVAGVMGQLGSKTKTTPFLFFVFLWVKRSCSPKAGDSILVDTGSAHLSHTSRVFKDKGSGRHFFFF